MGSKTGGAGEHYEPPADIAWLFEPGADPPDGYGFGPVARRLIRENGHTPAYFMGRQGESPETVAKRIAAARKRRS